MRFGESAQANSKRKFDSERFNELDGIIDGREDVEVNSSKGHTGRLLEKIA